MSCIKKLEKKNNYSGKKTLHSYENPCPCTCGCYSPGSGRPLEYGAEMYMFGSSNMYGI